MTTAQRITLAVTSAVMLWLAVDPPPYSTRLVLRIAVFLIAAACVWVAASKRQ